MQADLYPSRISDKPSITKRKDPVVYTNSDDLNTLSKEQAESFEKNGYLLMPKFFSDEEVEVLKEELQRVMNEHRHSNDDEVIREPDSEDIRSVFDVHKRSEFFQKLSRHERIVHIVQDLLGSQAYIMQSRINFKPGFKGKEFYWHSDFETWHVEDGMPRMQRGKLLHHSHG